MSSKPQNMEVELGKGCAAEGTCGLAISLSMAASMSCRESSGTTALPWSAAAVLASAAVSPKSVSKRLLHSSCQAHTGSQPDDRASNDADVMRLERTPADLSHRHSREVYETL